MHRYVFYRYIIFQWIKGNSIDLDNLSTRFKNAGFLYHISTLCDGGLLIIIIIVADAQLHFDISLICLYTDVCIGSFALPCESDYV